MTFSLGFIPENGNWAEIQFRSPGELPVIS